LPQAFFEDMKDHDGSKGPSSLPRRRASRRHSIGSVRTLSSSDSILSMEAFWHMYEPKKDAPPDAAYTKRRGVRFRQDVTVWVFPNEGKARSDLPLAAMWVRASPETDDELMQIPLRKTHEEKIADLQRKAADYQKAMYKDDDSAGSLEFKQCTEASVSIDDALNQSSNFADLDLSDEESKSDSNELISSSHELCRFESPSDFQIPQNGEDDIDVDLRGLRLPPSSSCRPFHFDESDDACLIADDASMSSMLGEEVSASDGLHSDASYLSRIGDSFPFDGKSSNPGLGIPDMSVQGKHKKNKKVESPTSITACLSKLTTRDESIDCGSIEEVSEIPECPKDTPKRSERSQYLPGFHDSFESTKSENFDLFEDKSVLSNDYEQVLSAKKHSDDAPFNDDASVDSMTNRIKRELVPEMEKSEKIKNFFETKLLESMLIWSTGLLQKERLKLSP